MSGKFTTVMTKRPSHVLKRICFKCLPLHELSLSPLPIEENLFLHRYYLEFFPGDKVSSFKKPPKNRKS